MQTNHYIIKGRVQGVAFRYYTVQAARKYRITGSVKNLFNGDVEVCAQGTAEDIRGFEDFLHTGPPSARVSAVHKNKSTAHTNFDSFDVVY